MQDFGNTQFFKVEAEPETGVKVILSSVYEALTENPTDPSDETGPADGTAEAGENENPYAVTTESETKSAEETAETESTDDGVRNPMWY